jgi:hypothetical protein
MQACRSLDVEAWWPVRRLPSDLPAIVRVHCYVGRHLTTLNGSQHGECLLPSG